MRTAADQALNRALATAPVNVLRRRALRGCALVVALALAGEADAETLVSALARAYQNNPGLNQDRASLRARDEETTKALGGMRPQANISASAGPNYSTVKIPAGRDNFGHRAFYSDQFVGYPRGATLNVTQTLFDGGRTASAASQAESGVLSARASLLGSEQTTLLNGVTAYMNVLRDSAIFALRRSNVAVLEEQLKQTRERFQVGEVTRTDVSQAEAAFQQGRSEAYAAGAMLKANAAFYRQIIGAQPKRLEPAGAVEKLLPRSIAAAERIAITQHPSVVSAEHQVDAAEHAVKVAESALSPTASVSAQVSPQYDSFLGWPATRQFSAAAKATLNIPLYQGGSEYASIRQAKEQLGQARLAVDLARDNVRANLVSTFAQLDAVRASIVANQAAVKAAELSLSGVREEAKIGQRTTLDILNAQQALLGARVNLVIAQRDRVVASYSALAALGRLTAHDLNLSVAYYNPEAHYEQVRDRWFGLDTLDER